MLPINQAKADPAILAAEAVLIGADAIGGAATLSIAARGIVSLYSKCKSAGIVCTSALSVAAHAGLFSIVFNDTKIINKISNTTTPLTVSIANNPITKPTLPPGWSSVVDALNNYKQVPPSQVSIAGTSDLTAIWPAAFTNWNDAATYGVPQDPDYASYVYTPSTGGKQWRQVKIVNDNAGSSAKSTPDGFQYQLKLASKSVDGSSQWVVMKVALVAPVFLPTGYKQNVSDPTKADLVNPNVVQKPLNGKCEITNVNGNYAYDPQDPDCKAVASSSSSPIKISNQQVHLTTANGQSLIRGISSTQSVETDYYRDPSDPSKMKVDEYTIDHQSDGESVVSSVTSNSIPFPNSAPLSDVKYGPGGDFVESGTGLGSSSGTSSGSGSSTTNVNIDTSLLSKESTQTGILDKITSLSDIFDTTTAITELDAAKNTESADNANLTALQNYVSNSQFTDKNSSFYTAIKDKITAFFPTRNNVQCSGAQIPLPNFFTGIGTYGNLDLSYWCSTVAPYVNYFVWGIVGIYAYREINFHLGGYQNEFVPDAPISLAPSYKVQSSETRHQSKSGFLGG